jgi:hypothetical protein
MAHRLTVRERVRRDASLAFLHAFMEGRPLEELRTELPREFEATGQNDAAEIVRSFFALRRNASRGDLRSLRT